MDPFKEALISNLAQAEISEDERSYLETTTKEDLIQELNTADKAHQKQSIARNVSKRLAPLVDCILQYAGALDVMSNVDPLPVSVIWGAVKIVLQLASSFEKYFDKLLAMFERISDILPRFDLYLRLFPNRQELMASMTRLYCDVVQFCLQARRVFKFELSPSRRKFHVGTSAKVAWKNCWKDFELQFGNLLENFREHKNHVEEEAKAAAMEDSQTRLKTLEMHSQDQTLAIRGVQDAQGDSAKQQTSIEFQYLMAWLGGGIENEPILRKNVSLRYPGTGDWLLAHPVLKSWLQKDATAGDKGDVLWCYGPAGIGKTSLCAYLIQQLVSGTLTGHDEHLNTTLYHFCDFRNYASTRSTSILGCLLRQALEPRQFLNGQNTELLRTRRYRGETVLGDDFADNLENIFEDSFYRGYIVLDALDECVDPEQILQRILRCAQRNHRRIKILVVSRDSINIRNVLDTFPKLALSSQLLEHDVKLFISKEVDRLVHDKVLKARDQQLPASIVTELSKRAEGMFLWAKLQLESVSRKHTDRAIRTAIEQLPLGLITSYQRTISNFALLPEDEQDLIKRLFQWIVCSTRPMTVAELSLCLLAMNTKTGMLEEDNIVTDLPDLAVLASGLLIVEPALKDAESTVVVSHRSVQDFLVSTNAGDFKVDRESTNAHISLVTLKFLILPDFSTVCESWEELNGRLSKFPFLDYAARFWPSHVMESGGMTPEALETMATLFMGSNFLPWLQVYKSNRSIPNHQTFHVDATPLYWAARLGLKELVVRMLSLGTQINESGGFFGTALTMAAYNGDVPMVKLLLANGADVNHRAGQYHTALQAAAFTGSEVIVNMLIDSGADVHARGGIFSTALIAAEKAGHQSIVKRLLDLGLEQPQRYETADKAEFLGTAILRRDVPAVRRIIEAGININDRLPGFSDWQKEEPESDHSHYPLILALSGGCLEIVKCIIDAGADLDVSDGYHGSALAYAAYRGQEDIVRALLDGGANPLPRTETYSGSSLPGYIKRIDAAEREKMNRGKGLKIWADNFPKEEIGPYSEKKSIIDVLEGRE